eukprot:403361559
MHNHLMTMFDESEYLDQEDSLMGEQDNQRWPVFIDERNLTSLQNKIQEFNFMKRSQSVDYTNMGESFQIAQQTEYDTISGQRDQDEQQAQDFIVENSNENYKVVDYDTYQDQDSQIISQHSQDNIAYYTQQNPNQILDDQSQVTQSFPKQQHQKLTQDQQTRQKIKSLIEKRKKKVYSDRKHSLASRVSNTNAITSVSTTDQNIQQLITSNQLPNSSQFSAFSNDGKFTNRTEQQPNQQRDNFSLVKDYKIVNYLNPQQKSLESNLIQTNRDGQSFKEMMLNTLMRKRGPSNRQILSPIEKQKPSQILMNMSDIDSMEMIDKIFQKEQEVNGVRVFREGEELKNGLIDINKVYQVILKQEKDGPNPSDSFISRTQKLSQKQKWQKVLDYASQNPQFLLDAIPTTDISLINSVITSVKEEKYSGLFNDQSDTTFTSANVSTQSKIKQKLHSNLNLSRQIGQDSVYTLNELETFNDQHNLKIGIDSNTSVQSHYNKIKEGYNQNKLLTQQNKQLSQERPFSFCEQRQQTSKPSHSNRAFSQFQARNGLNKRKINQDLNINQDVDNQSEHKRQNSKFPTIKHQDTQKTKLNQTQASQFLRRDQTRSNNKRVPKSISNNRKKIDKEFINDGGLYVNDDIDYLINMIRLNEKSIEKSASLNMIYNKVLNTVRSICKELLLENLSTKISLHYEEVNSKVLIKLLLRCKSFFVIRMKILKILKQINDRELLLNQLKKIVNELQETDERALQTLSSEKSQILFQMNQRIQDSTNETKKLILQFLSENHKYFGKVFCYDGTDYLEVARREAREINDVINLIRGDEQDDELRE